MASSTVSRQLVRRIARRWGIDPNVFERQIGLESGFQKHVTSSAGAEGPAQLLPSTARELGVNINNPVQNLEGGAKYLSQQLKAFGGNYRKALAAYNAGPGNIPAGLGYADKILNGKTPTASGRFPSASAGSKGAATRTIPGQDNSGERRSLLLNYLLNGGTDTTGQGLLDTVIQIKQTPDVPARTVKVKGTGSTVQLGSNAAGPHHTVTFDGKPVVAWIAKRLSRARASGLWNGKVISGERTKSQQLAAAKNFGLQNYGPGGPLGSNHVIGHDGAVDVTDPAGLRRALGTLGIKKLKSSMPNDTEHFSRTGY